MNDLSRLLESSEDELALSLLRSAHEEPPEGSMGRVAAALGVGGAVVSGAAATALLASKAQAAAVTGATTALGAEAAVASSPWILSVVAKPLAIGLIGGLAAVGGANLVSSKPAPLGAPKAASTIDARLAPPEAAAERRAQPAVRAPVAEAADAALASSKVEPAKQPMALAVTPTGRRAAAPVAPEAPRVAAPVVQSSAAPAPEAESPVVMKQEQAAPRDESLARELGILARARSLLVSGNPAGALRALDQYSAERRSGALEPEATTLRIQSLERLGDRNAAARLARSFLKAHPERSHDDSLRSLAGEAP